MEPVDRHQHAPDISFDGGDLDCGNGLLLLIRKHIDPSVKVIIASAGSKKPEYVLKTTGRVTHVLLDDTQKNIDVWDNVALHRIAIHHTDASSSIKKLQPFVIE